MYHLSMRQLFTSLKACRISHDEMPLLRELTIPSWIIYLWLMSEQLTLSSIQAQLIEALEKSRAASKTLEDAQAKLAPLEVKALEAQEHVSQLMSEFNRLTG